MVKWESMVSIEMMESSYNFESEMQKYDTIKLFSFPFCIGLVGYILQTFTYLFYSFIAYFFFPSFSFIVITKFKYEDHFTKSYHSYSN